MSRDTVRDLLHCVTCLRKCPDYARRWFLPSSLTHRGVSPGNGAARQMKGRRQNPKDRDCLSLDLQLKGPTEKSKNVDQNSLTVSNKILCCSSLPSSTAYLFLGNNLQWQNIKWLSNCDCSHYWQKIKKLKSKQEVFQRTNENKLFE